MRPLHVTLASLVMIGWGHSANAQEMKWLNSAPKTSDNVGKGIYISVDVDLTKVDTDNVRITYWEQGKKLPASPQYTPKLDGNGQFTGNIVASAADTEFQIIVDAVDDTTGATYRLSGKAKSRKDP